MKTLIKRTVFQNFSKNGNGGIFEIYSINIAVECCSFVSDHVTLFGGCLFASECNIEIYKTSFDKCYTSAQADEYSGNAVYASKNSLVIDMISTYQCGPTSTLCSDSSIRATSATAKVKNVNATENYGYIGSSAMAIDYAVVGSFIKYLQDVSGKDYISIQSVSNQYDACFSNFINQTSHIYICWANANYIIEYESCVFWNIGNVPFCNYVCSFKTCISNGDISDVTKTDVYSVNMINIMRCGVAITKMSCSKYVIHIVFMVLLVLS